MKLLEHKGKELLRNCGIRTPAGIVTNNMSYINLSYHKERYTEFFFEHKKVVIKAQVIAGKRKKEGLIVDSADYSESLKHIDEMYHRSWKGQPIHTLLIEKALEVESEHYLSIIYDTISRRPMILLSQEGGTDIESKAKPSSIIVDPLDTFHEHDARTLAKQAGFEGRDLISIATFISKAYKCFLKYDCRILEINPIIRTPEGLLFAGDAKITIDDSSVTRQEVFKDVTDIEDRSFLTERALEARKIDYHDYRGVAGKTFLELDGDIAVIASGGGASLTIMDALLEAGGKPANYTEYSGNPSREKIRQLTKITLSRKGLRGCLVAGGRANFTDIMETLSGFAEGLLEVTPKPDYPIVIRRAGPRADEAFAMLKEFAKKHPFNIILYGEETPITKAARIIVEKSKEGTK